MGLVLGGSVRGLLGPPFPYSPVLRPDLSTPLPFGPLASPMSASAALRSFAVDEKLMEQTFRFRPSADGR